MTPALTQRRPARLKNITISEVSLVDRGANQHAHVILMKREDEAPAIGTPLSRLASLAKAVARSEGTTPEQAYAVALAQNPGLYDAAEAARLEAQGEGAGSEAAEALAAFEQRLEAEARTLAQRTGWSRERAQGELMVGAVYDQYEQLRQAAVLEAQANI